MEKKVLLNLEKCYSIAPLTYQNKSHILVAAEKTDRCVLFDMDGVEEETIWEGPGGVMSMVQVPGTNGQFLATHQFYSPNDSKEAKIVIATPQENNKWEIRTLVDLPFVHRFDILEHNGVRYLIACTIKSGHEYKEDWTNPGKVYGAILPDDLSGFNEDHQLELQVIKDGMLKNHGYFRVQNDHSIASLIASENGVFLFYPPQDLNGEWVVEQLLDAPTSDATMIDLDGDGEKELVTLAPFHGSSIKIYKKINDKYEVVYEYDEEAPFLHAIWSGDLEGKGTVVLGHRQGKRQLLAFTWDETQNQYAVKVIDEGCGPANVYGYKWNNKDVLIATNREVDEVAMYLF